MRRGVGEQPTVAETKFGWAVSGTVCGGDVSGSKVSFAFRRYTCCFVF